jgi:O-antigen chain-terminating methyltransferase
MIGQNGKVDVDALIAGIRAELSPAPKASTAIAEPKPPSVDDILRRVRHEIALRRGIAPLSHDDVASDPAGHFPRWQAAADRLPVKPEYVLGDFLALDDADFVETAYRGLLRRPPDEAGFRHHLRALRESEMSKVEVLASLRWSPEGEARGVHVDGLLLPFWLHRWQRKPVLGPMLRWLHAWLRAPSLMERQAQQGLRQAREAQELGQHVNVVAAQAEQSFSRVQSGLSEMLARLSDVEAALARTDAVALRHEAMLRHSEAAHVAQSAESARAARVQQQAEFALAQTQEQLAQARAELDQICDSLAQTRYALAATRSDLDLARSELTVWGLSHRTLEEAVDGIGDKSTVLAENVARLDDALQALMVARDKAVGHERDLDALYARFEERFRGSEMLIRERVGEYLPNVKALGPQARVVDLGCGRGEWLQLMKENGITSLGVDTNRVFLQACRERGLDVVEADAIAWLLAQPDASVSGLTSLHLVEHLPFEALMQMLREAYRVVVPGGLLLLETPNPENLLVSTHGFYMDPTHRNPLPPDMLAWLVQSQGFEAVQVQRLTLAREMDVPPLVTADVPGASSVNPLLQRLHAAPDYAIVARRP